MVKVKEMTSFLPDGSIDAEQWLQHLGNKGYFQDIELIRNACTLGQLGGLEHATESGASAFQQGLAMADILADLEVDQETIAAAIAYECVHYADLSLDVVEEHLGLAISRLVKGVEKMNAISNFSMLSKYPQNKHQLDNVRKMLLAMVDDVRVVLIKLAERLCLLRTATPLPTPYYKQIATEAMDIYAPLANRLGIGAIKWEMEDLAFRHLHPEEYKEIAKGLKARRLERDQFVEQIVKELKQEMETMGFKHFAVYGRSKHIHSIHRKMKRKNVALDEIYDATAVRILVEDEKECYEAISLVHSLWQQVMAEYDDYIVHPKENGYQSLHTAVKSEGRVFEVQIRTFKMHEQAEMGVAAHWKYKEGVSHSKESHERKIEWLREVLAWQRDIAKQQGISEAIEMEFLEDRVYVFTPDGDVLDLPQGVTPLDFAYHVHTELGHRCRGAKINGQIVPLTYMLKTGNVIEILSGKDARPSRDWINPHLNYLKTSRAKAKVLHWFKLQDFDKICAAGYELLEKELKALGIKTERLTEVLHSLKLKNLDDLYAALGRGDLKVNHVLSRLSPAETHSHFQTIVKPQLKPEISGSDLQIAGVGNLLTTMARCCQPVPGDKVIGYITLGRGVSIHREDCSNIISANEKQRRRFIQVSWGNTVRDHYIVDIAIKAFDRTGLLKDITALLAHEKANVYSLQTSMNKDENLSFMNLKVEVDGLNALSRLLTLLGQIPNVLEARRQV